MAVNDVSVLQLLCTLSDMRGKLDLHLRWLQGTRCTHANSDHVRGRLRQQGSQLARLFIFGNRIVQLPVA